MPPDPAGVPPQDSPHPSEAYAVQERIAVGTAGVVYRALQQATGSEVLFKVLMPEASHPLDGGCVLSLRPRLLELKHPHIAPMLDAYEDPEGTVLVYGMSKGTAGNHFPHQNPPLSSRALREVARQLCETLAAGEEARFPHGDLKPSNLVIHEENASLSVQVQDWGLSQCRALQPPESMLYLAPERLYGHPPSPKADLFSAAAVLWYLATGRSPVDPAHRDQLLAAWGAFRVDTLAGLRPDVDAHFRQWLGWLLRWQPPERPASASVALAALDDAALLPELSMATGALPTAEDMAPPRAPQESSATTTETSSTAPTERLKTTAPTAKLERAESRDQAAKGGNCILRLLVILFFTVASSGAALVLWAEQKWGDAWKEKLTEEFRMRWNQLPGGASGR